MTKIIAFAGKKQSGKTSAAYFLGDHFSNKKILIYSFAAPLKEICVDILGLDPRQCYGEDRYKNELVNCYWEGKQLTARETMQIIGTEWFRTMQESVWTDAIIRKINKDNPDIAIIDDCRFPNEVQAVRKADGLVFKLERSMFHSSHASEVALDRHNYDQLNFDAVVMNQYMDLDTKNEVILRILSEKGIA